MPPATASENAVAILPATATLPTVPIEPATVVLATVAADPATPALATVAADPATATLAAVAAEPATAELATVATDPATAVLAAVAPDSTRPLGVFAAVTFARFTTSNLNIHIRVGKVPADPTSRCCPSRAIRASKSWSEPRSFNARRAS